MSSRTFYFSALWLMCRTKWEWIQRQKEVENLKNSSSNLKICGNVANCEERCEDEMSHLKLGEIQLILIFSTSSSSSGQIAAFAMAIIAEQSSSGAFQFFTKKIFHVPQRIRRKVVTRNRLIDHRKSHQSHSEREPTKSKKDEKYHTLHPSYKTLKKIVEIISL